MPIQHQGPHPTWPVPPPPPCPTGVAQAASRAAASRGASTGSGVLALSQSDLSSTTPISTCHIFTTDGTVLIVGNATLQEAQAAPLSDD